jgi:guanylate kinase
MENDSKLFVIAAPSGTGKTTLVQTLLKRNPNLCFSISYTTRKRRDNESNGKDYIFVDTGEFQKLRDNNQFLESAVVFDNYYGTSRVQINKKLSKGKNMLLEIDWQGAQQVKQSMPGSILIFIFPPSLEELEKRLRNRKTETDIIIEKRLKSALKDMSHWEEFDYCIINDDLDKTVEELECIFSNKGWKNKTDNDFLRKSIRNILV